MSDVVVDAWNCKLVVATTTYDKESTPYLDKEVSISTGIETILWSLKNVGN